MIRRLTALIFLLAVLGGAAAASGLPPVQS